LYTVYQYVLYFASKLLACLLCCNVNRLVSMDS